MEPYWCRLSNVKMAQPQIHTYLAPLQKAYEAQRDDAQAEEMSRYMKSLFPFIGIPSPYRKEVFKQHLALHGLPEYKDLFAIVKSAYAQPEREFHYIAIDLAGKFAKTADGSFVPLLEFLITKNSWWDSVDSVASNCTRDFFKRNIPLQIPVTGKWMNSENMWLQRASILFQLNYKNNTNEKLLYKYILHLKESPEFFIQKAIGWALREYSKTNPQSVKRFLANNDLPKLSVREASKYIS
ncbi:MAG: DNA alkylation repair protein [Chitinophagales bacterium]